MERLSVCNLLHADFSLGLFFDPEDEGDIFLRNVGWLSTNYTELYPRRQNSSFCGLFSKDLSTSKYSMEY
jgi:hypothetical protein